MIFRGKHINYVPVLLSTMKVVVTGGCGFIGSNLAEELSKYYDVVVVDNLSTGSFDNLKGLDVEFVEGDITDLGLLQDLFKDVDYVFHQAAVVSVPESIEDPLKANEVNIGGTLNVLIAARDCGVKKVVNASSCAVYGDVHELPVSEDVTPKPLNPYAVTKLASEYYCRIFSEVYGLNTASLRYFNIYGPGQSPESDYAAVIPQFIHRALNGRELVIHGDGEQTRDFVFVKDVVRANILAMVSKENGVFNVASGKQVSINQLASLIAGDVGVTYGQPREGDIKHSVGDTSKAKLLGFETVYSVEDGLRETIEWYKERQKS